MSALVVSIPHASDALPAELDGAFLAHVDTAFLRAASDVDTDGIYAQPGVRSIRYAVSRVVADPNRAESQTTEGGVVPTRDFHGRALYAPGRAPDADERQRRVLRWHRPFHEAVAAEVADPRTRFFVDAHSMAGTPPDHALDRGQARPDALLANRGDAEGEGAEGNADGADPSRGGGPLTCPPALTRALRDRLAHRLVALPAPPAPHLRAPSGSVWLNRPFPGGHVVRTHARPAAGVPGLMIELNQGLWVDERTWRTDPERLAWARAVVERWFEDVVRLVGAESLAAGRPG